MGGVKYDYIVFESNRIGNFYNFFFAILLLTKIELTGLLLERNPYHEVTMEI